MGITVGKKTKGNTTHKGRHIAMAKKTGHSSGIGKGSGISMKKGKSKKMMMK